MAASNKPLPSAEHSSDGELMTPVDLSSASVVRARHGSARPTSSHSTSSGTTPRPALVFDDLTSLDPRNRVERRARRRIIETVSETQGRSICSFSSPDEEFDEFSMMSTSSINSVSGSGSAGSSGSSGTPHISSSVVAITPIGILVRSTKTASSPDAGAHTSNTDRFRSRYVRMEERLEDDLLNAYCNKLHEAVENEVDGLLAMQYIILEPQHLKRLVTDKKGTCQVIFDEQRKHYLVVARYPDRSGLIVVYDPIVAPDNISLTLNPSVCRQIASLFGHLLGERETLSVAVEAGIQPQADSWSCGLRAVAHITHIVLGCNPLDYEYELEPIREFFSSILDTNKPDRLCFERAIFGKQCNRRESHLIKAQITHSGELLIDGRKSGIGEAGATVDSKGVEGSQAPYGYSGVRDEIYKTHSSRSDDHFQDATARSGQQRLTK